MKPVFLFSVAAFVAGLSLVLIWPSRTGMELSAARKTISLSSPLGRLPGAAASAPRTRLARLSQARERIAGMSATEARDALMQLSAPPSESDREWWSSLLEKWAEGEPAEAVEWMKKTNRQTPVTFDLVSPALATVARKDLRMALVAGQPWAGYDQSDLFRAAARVNPKAAVEFCVSGPAASRMGLSAAFSEWLVADEDAALNWLQSDGRPNASRISSQMMPDLLKLTPAKLDRLMSVLPASERKQVVWSRALTQGRLDPEVTMARLGDLEGDEKLAAIEGTGSGLLAKGDAEGLRRLMASLSGEERKYIFADLALGISSIPPEKLKVLSGLPGLTFDERLKFFTNDASLGTGDPEEFMAALEELKKAPDAKVPQINEAMERKWSLVISQGDPGNLKTFGRLLSEGKLDKDLPLLLLGQFGSYRDEAAMARILSSLPEGQQAAPKALMAGYAALQDPEADLSALTAPGIPEADRLKVFQAVFQHNLNHNTPEGRKGQIALLEHLPVEMRAQAFSQGIQAWSVDWAGDFQPMVRKMVEESTEWTGALDQSLSRIGQSLATTDPAAAFAWMAVAPEGPARERLGESVFSIVLTKNAIAASEWLAAQPGGQPRDRMTERMIQQIQSSDPASAWQWAASVSDARLRQALQKQVLPLWKAADPAAAEQAVEALVQN